jgi:hypothetical protein
MHLRANPVWLIEILTKTAFRSTPPRSYVFPHRVPGIRSSAATKCISLVPVSLCNDTSALHPAMERALRSWRVSFRVVSEVGTIKTVSATLRTDLDATEKIDRFPGRLRASVEGVR